MISYQADYAYLPSGGEKIFTVTLLPDAKGNFPVVLMRTPYVDNYENWPEADIAMDYLNTNRAWLRRGYALVIQHCRGRGKSTGDCIPYINEREDGLNLQAWVRRQPFYNGEIYLKGGSYTTSVHYLTAPFADDIKGAIFGVQDSDRYNATYRNGFFKTGLHGNWYVSMYKAKSHMKKNFTPVSYDLLPLRDFCRTVFGEEVPSFQEKLRQNKPTDPVWNTCNGISNTRGVTDDAHFPILFTTGFYDIYTGGIFNMWRQMNAENKARSAMIVSPYDHGDRCNNETSMAVEKGKRTEQFGEEYEIDWLDSIRDPRIAPPVPTGKITYYRLFENKWQSDDFMPGEKQITLPLGDHAETYTYNPFDAPSFQGGLCNSFGGCLFQDPPHRRHDIITVYSSPFEQDTFVKGKMAASLKVASDCEDTCFYMRLSITKERGDLGLRDDITSLCYQLGDYAPGQDVSLSFSFDEHAFLIKKGERLRVDIASACQNHFVRHTNQKGPYLDQETAKVAHNTVFLQDSFLTLPVE